MSYYSSVTPACASANVSTSPLIVCVPLGPISGPSRAAGQAQNGALGSRGLHGLSTGRTNPCSATADCAQYWPSVIVSETWSLHVDSRTPRCPAGRRRSGWNYRSHRPAPVSTHLWNGDATGGRPLCPHHATPGSQGPAHDLGIRRNDQNRPQPRVRLVQG